MENKYEIILDFDQNEENPERIFKTIAMLFEDLKSVDKMLCNSLPVNISTKTYLNCVENGSIKLKIVEMIKMLDDEALENGDFSKVAGRFIKQGKYMFLDYMSKLDDNPKKIEQLQADLLKKTKEYPLGDLKVYKKIPKQELVKNIDKLNTTFGNLTTKEKLLFKQDFQEMQLQYNPKITKAELTDEITETILVNTVKMILKIKKPDYLGDTQWDFIFQGKKLTAKIFDIEWLRKYQNNEVEAMPQDSLDCMVKVTTKYDEHNDVIDDSHEIIKINNVVKSSDGTQGSIFG